MKTLHGILLIPVYFVMAMLILAAIPGLLEAIFDPPRKKFIKKFFEAAGCTDIKIKAFPNHYGIRYSYNGTKLYAKCRANMKNRTIIWVGTAPVWARPN